MGTWLHLPVVYPTLKLKYSKKIGFNDAFKQNFRKQSAYGTIDIEGKMSSHIRFPGFATYELREKNEEHLDDLLTRKIRSQS